MHTQYERLAILETNVKNIEEKVDKILLKLDIMDSRYSGKWVEKVAIAIGTVIGLGALYAILRMANIPV